MKTSQWIAALAALAGVVFIVTFAINYIGIAPQQAIPVKEQSDEPDPPTLTFVRKQYPYMDENQQLVGRLELEHLKPSYHDFWFKNENDEKIRIGGLRKSCKCQAIEVFILPAGYEVQHPSPVATAAAAGLTGLRGAAAADEESTQVSPELEKKASCVNLNPDDPNAEATVPPHGSGWVRMKWTGEKAGSVTLSVVLWMQNPDSGLTATLERRAFFLDPISVGDTDRSLGSFRPTSLPKEFAFLIWSSTRKEFKITKAEPYRPANRPAEIDPFVVGKPVELSLEECDQIEKGIGQRVVSAYRIPLSLLKVAPDGKTPFDLGHFRRQVEITTNVSSDKPITMIFTGVVQGDDVQVGGDDSGGVNFGSFRRDSQPMRFVFLRSGSPDLKLELDETRVPNYLQAKLTEESSIGGLGKTWKLEVSALKNVNGRFPREDDPAYRDSAVYVHTVGPAPQTIRIPAKGDAVDR